MLKFAERLFQAMLPAAAAALSMAALPVAHADVVYQTSFENPPFAVGPIAGQDGWSVYGPSTPTIENNFAFSGSQAVFVDGGTATQSGPDHSDSPTGPLIDLSAEIAVFTSSTESEWQFAGLGPGLVPFLGGIDIYADDSIHAISAGYADIGTFPRATAFNSSAWHQIDLLFNMNSQTYNISLDGSTLATNLPFCGDNSVCAGAPVSSYGSTIFDSFGAQSTLNNATANDSGYMDNFLLANVPEPSSLLLFGAGLAVAAARIKRQRAR